MIDEKIVIKKLKKMQGINTLAMMFISDVVKMLRQQPKIGEWIPCSERLPEQGNRYLVSVIWKEEDFEEYSVYDAVYGLDGNWHGYNYDPMPCAVIAWQPLPEPYKIKS